MQIKQITLEVIIEEVGAVKSHRRRDESGNVIDVLTGKRVGYYADTRISLEELEVVKKSIQKELPKIVRLIKDQKDNNKSKKARGEEAKKGWKGRRSDIQKIDEMKTRVDKLLGEDDNER